MEEIEYWITKENELKMIPAVSEEVDFMRLNRFRLMMVKSYEEEHKTVDFSGAILELQETLTDLRNAANLKIRNLFK